MTPPQRTIPPYVAAVRVARDGVEQSVGSGFLADAFHIVTCAHVITHALPEERRRPLRAGLDEEVGSAAAAAQRGLTIHISAGFESGRETRIEARVHAEDPAHDLTVLRLEKPIYGVVPPAFGLGRRIEGLCIGFGAQAGRIARFEWENISGASFFESGTDDHPSYLQHLHGAPAGFSGGPLVIEDKAGRHHLLGVAGVGGFASSTGIDIAAAPILRLLRQETNWREPTGDAGMAAEGVPGAAQRFDLPCANIAAAAFRFVGNDSEPLFRAERPLSAAEARTICGDEKLAGAERLPAHAGGPDVLFRLLETLKRQASGHLRLPTVLELRALAEEDAAGQDIGGFGLPALLDDYRTDAAVLATPPGTAEWALGPDRQPRVYLRQRDHGGLTALADAQAAGEAPSHLRFAVRPMFDPESRP
ncbi:MAG: trypsin-like peptidase domain-containing protein [Rhizobiaceae bacterium]|nr:trypsin-like peptidase domain-containing protein [Rhizobiaceae bacterium]